MSIADGPMSTDEFRKAIATISARQYRYGMTTVASSRLSRERPRPAVSAGAPIVCANASVVSVMASTADHRGDDLLLRDVGTAELGANGAVVQDEDPVAQGDQLGDIGRVEQDPDSRVRLLAHEVEDLRLRSDVDTAGRVVQQQQLRLQRQDTSE